MTGTASTTNWTLVDAPPSDGTSRHLLMLYQGFDVHVI